MGKLYIYGAGGLGKEVLDLARQVDGERFSDYVFLDSNPVLTGKEISGIDVKTPDSFSIYDGHIAIAIADPGIKKRIIQSLPKETKYATLVHPTVILGSNVRIGRGSILSAGVKISCDTEIGEFAHVNFNCTIGHDCRIKDHFTAAPGANISGNVSIGDEVFCGTQAAIKQGIRIANTVVIGMSSSVIRDVQEEGVTVFGNPARVIIKSKNQ